MEAAAGAIHDVMDESQSEDTGTTLMDFFGSSATTKVSRDYLDYLTTLPLSTLLSEPTLLQTQSHHLTSSLTSLTHTSYSTFISLHTTTTALTSSLNEFSSTLDSLLNESLPALEDSSSTWRERTDSVLSERRKARVVLEQHDKIRDLLDIPPLIESCVRNGYFSEALALSARAKSVTSSYSTSSRTPPLVLTSVMSEVQIVMDHMLLTLLSTLQEPNRKLPALWKAVNFIRKMDAFRDDGSDADPNAVHPEEQIALAFLSGREKCLNAALEGCKRDIMRLVEASTLQEKDKSDLVEHLRKYIDVWRKETSDIVAQYTSIFLDHLSPENSDRILSSSLAPVPAELPGRVRSLLTTYTFHNLESHLIPMLSPKLTLSRIPLSLLQSILKPLTFCCNSFARIGMDFRGILGSLFADAVVAIVTEELQNHARAWTDTLTEKTGSRTIAPPKRLSVIAPGSNKNVNVLHPLQPPSKWLISPTATSPPPTPISATVQLPAHVPPPTLTTYPPLAVLTNAILTTFNNLRLIAPTKICAALQTVLDKEITRCGKALLVYLRCVVEDPALKSANWTNGYSEHGNGDVKVDKVTKEEQTVVAVGEVFFGIWVPFIRRALGEGVYGIKEDYGLEALRSDVKTNGSAVPLGAEEATKIGSHQLPDVVREWEGWRNALQSRS
ncbi:Dor1-domain-containing protein [Marasmius fiardii PR-910]|nr:Dor1-domain-containing protein [Marasmius fiardii PR-910]